MSVVEVVDDLLALEELAAHEDDPARRRLVDAVRDHVADRDRGAKVSEVAQVLGISQPTVRAWIEAGVLAPRGDTTPVRVDVLSLAAVKRALDLLREHGEDRNPPYRRHERSARPGRARGRRRPRGPRGPCYSASGPLD